MVEMMNRESSYAELDFSRITQLLSRWRNGDSDAREQVFKALYPDIKAIAQRQLNAQHSGRLTLRATELVHEAYGRLIQQHAEWKSRNHFLAIVAQVFRRVAVDLARQRATEKRGAEIELQPISDTEGHAGADANDLADLLALDQAIGLLERREPQAAQIMELRYFSGMTSEEVAEYLGIGVATVVRHWRFGRAFLFRRLS